jgi:hypothetical protein
MKLCELTPSVDAALSRKLCEFEALFDYPLGNSQRFRIDHSTDYTAFYRAIGEARTWMIDSGDSIIAAISTAVRSVKIQGEPKRIAYIGDLKIHPQHQSGRVLFHIARCLQPLLEQTATFAYGVVMDGTQFTPEHYTGRLGIPQFRPVAKLHILRIEASDWRGTASSNVSAQEGYALYSQLNNAVSDPASTKLRSKMIPHWLAVAGQACGMLEDTRRAKRLYLTRGEELLSAHLSCFAFKDTAAACAILHNALDCAYQQGYPAMFVALSEAQYDLLAPSLQSFRYTTAPATVYATDSICAYIPVNTSEI